MATFNLNTIESALSTLNEVGVSFEGKAKKWENADEAKEVVDEINNCKELLCLNLEGNTLGVEAAVAIGSALKTHPEFKKALLKDLFTGRLKTEIPQALKALGSGMIFAGAKLAVLDCSDNALGPNGMVGLVELLESPTCYSLQELKLNNCGLGIEGGKMLAKALLNGYNESLKFGPPLALKVFVAGRNRLENPGATALAEVFKTLKSLEEISIPQNGIYHIGISALSDALKVNFNMRVLNLNDNTIGPKGSESLSLALPHMQKLKEINFGDCLLKTDGAVWLANAITDRHLSLETLNLEFNEIGPRGGRVISFAVENKTNLENLLLNGNRFGSEIKLEILGDLKTLNREHILGSLEEDESVDDEEEEDDEDDYDDEDVDGEEEYDEEYPEEEYPEEDPYPENDTTVNSSIDTSLLFVQSQNLPKTIESFVRMPNPTEKFFNEIIETNKSEGFRNFLSTIPKDSYITYTVFTILKLAAISEQSNEALEITNELFKDVFKFAATNDHVSRVRNFFLVQLGLLKPEEKLFRPAFDVKACRNALKYAIDKDSIPSTQKEIFLCFLERFN